MDQQCSKFGCLASYVVALPLALGTAVSMILLNHDPWS